VLRESLPLLQQAAICAGKLPILLLISGDMHPIFGWTGLFHRIPPELSG
jgi:hypothetical protein